ncbi:hypothetical protein GY12_14090 [Micrococcus luteus]|nr:hypothetical protein GY12_14090 [Micrococcus luteus]
MTPVRGDAGAEAVAAVVAATRDHRMTFPIKARVSLTSPHQPEPEVYEVRARGDGGFAAWSARHDLSYDPRTGQERLVVHASPGQEGFTRERVWPWLSPSHRVLAMFAPAELGIWGGTHDQHRVCAARWLGERAVRVDLVRREEPAGSEATGYAEVDLGNAVVTRMLLDGEAYVLAAARVVDDGGRDRAGRRAAPAGVAALIRPLRLRIRHAQDPLVSLVGARLWTDREFSGHRASAFIDCDVAHD